MSKPALGRNLGRLMEEAKASPPSNEPAAQPTSLSPGMATLLRGANGTAQAPYPQPNLRHKRVLQVSLLLADLLLLGLALWLSLKGRGAFGTVGLVLCVLSVVLGAWLSCLALLVK